jgi:hypothetical protein
LAIGKNMPGCLRQLGSQSNGEKHAGSRTTAPQQALQLLVAKAAEALQQAAFGDSQGARGHRQITFIFDQLSPVAC